MKKLVYAILCLACLGIGHFCGSHDIFLSTDYTPACWDKDAIIYQLRSENIAYTNLLHRVYGNMDNECWEDLIMATPEYWALDSVLHEGAGWEDFYCSAWDEPCAGYAEGDTLEIPVGYDYL